MTTVSSYGIHFDSDRVGWLEQGRGGTNAIGQKTRSPFMVKLASGRRNCNHQIPLAVPVPHDLHWGIFMALQQDPLVRALMPFPKPDPGLFYIEDSERLTDYLFMLTRMASPIVPSAMPFWSFDDPRNLMTALAETNVQPLVLYGAKTGDISLLRQIAQPAAIQPRKLIISGTNDIALPTAMKKIRTELTSGKYDFNELNVLPWETLGAVAIRKWMRHEWADENTVAKSVRAE